MFQFLPYALAAYGGYKGYRQAKDAGASGIGRLLGAAGGATAGYYGGKTLLNMPGLQGLPGASKFTPFTQTSLGTSLAQMPVIGNMIPQSTAPVTQTSGSIAASQTMPTGITASQDPRMFAATSNANVQNVANLDKRNLMEKLFYKKNVAEGTGAITAGDIDPLKLTGIIAGGTYLSGAFEPGPVDMYQPTYNINYPKFAAARGPFKYIDADTGQEKTYEQPYMPESDPSNPYKFEKVRMRTGGLAEIRKFNEGGVNYLPSKVSHDENDSSNYVRATGYVEDGSGAGDKDEDTMLAQLADGEFVTRADGVLGAGIIAGANPNSFKDMREKGAAYFYDQQKKYKRVFDLLQEANGQNSKKN